MTRLKFLFFIVLLFVIGKEDAQAQIDFFPSGAEWFYSFKSPGLIPTRGYTHIRLIGDIEIGGRQAKQLGRTTYILDYDDPTISIDTIPEKYFYMAQSEDSIFYFLDPAFLFLWRSDVQPGDQIEVGDEWSDIYQMNIDSTADTFIGIEETKKIWLSGGQMYCCWGSTIIYDRFGPVNGFRYYNCWGYYDCYEPSLCRYKSDATGVVDFNGSYCENLLVSTTDFIQMEVKVYPNPATNFLKITVPELEQSKAPVRLFNHIGQLVYTGQLVNKETLEINIMSLPSGMYFCQIGSSIVKVIKL